MTRKHDAKSEVPSPDTDNVVHMDEELHIPHAYIATPAYDGKVDTDYSQALASASWHAAALGVQVTASVMGNGAFIELARNIFCKFFLEHDELKDCTHLFFIDSDLKFGANAFHGLITADKPICAGIYPRRQSPPDYPCTWWPLPDQDEDNRLWIDDDGWLKVRRVPTGFLCIRRDIIEEMAAEAEWLDIHGQEGGVPWLFETLVTLDGRTDGQRKFMGEDFVFCDKYVAKYQKPIDVWMDFDFVHGGYEGNYLKYLNEQTELYKQYQEDNKKPRGFKRKRA